MKKVLNIVLILTFAAACNMEGLKNNLQDAAALQKNIPADNISISTSFSTDSPEPTTEIKITNMHECRYSNLSLARQTMCVAMSYYTNLPDSARENLYLKVVMASSTKDGIITKTNSQYIAYNNSELQLADSIYAKVTAMLDKARANQSFAGLHDYVDTLSLPDSVFNGVDTMAAVLFSPASAPEYTFFGFGETTVSGTSEKGYVIWVYMNNETKYDVLRFILDKENSRVIGMSINPAE